MILAAGLYTSAALAVAAVICWAVREDGYRPGAAEIAVYVAMVVFWPAAIAAGLISAVISYCRR